jgi:hypothetical protein
VASPTALTLRLLYTFSGNLCAFPGCATPIVDAPTHTFTGEVCHIKARSPEGPRYDPNQSETARHAFENLVLMCPMHHKVIDDEHNLGLFTVERLQEMKADHEGRFAGGAEPTEDILKQMVVSVNIENTGNLNVGTIQQGSMIATHNQTGGQVAHSITNVATASPIHQLRVTAYPDALIHRPTGPLQIPAITTYALTVNIANTGTAVSYVSMIRLRFPIGEGTELATLYPNALGQMEHADRVVAELNPSLPFAVAPGRSQDYRFRVTHIRYALRELGGNDMPIEVLIEDEVGNKYSCQISEETRAKLVGYPDQ